MTVQELIDQLKRQDPKALVAITYDYGDYWHTAVARDIVCVATTDVTACERLNCNRLVIEDTDDYPVRKMGKSTEVRVIISATDGL